MDFKNQIAKKAILAIKNKVNVTVAVLEKLANALDVSVEELLKQL